MENNPADPTPGSQGGAAQLRMLQLLHLALVGGVMLFLGMSCFMIANQGSSLMTFNHERYLVFAYSSVGLSLSCVGASVILFRGKVAVITTNDMAAKLVEYRSAFIVRMALIESPVLFSVICYLFTAQWLFIAEALLLIGLMIYLRPGIVRITEELGLNPNEVNWLQST